MPNVQQRASCPYVKGKADGYGTYWGTECGHVVYCAAPEEVGMCFPPDPNEDGEYCRHCGGLISLDKKSGI